MCNRVLLNANSLLLYWLTLKFQGRSKNVKRKRKDDKDDNYAKRQPTPLELCFNKSTFLF